MDRVEAWLTEPLMLSHLSLFQSVVLTTLMAGWWGLYHLVVVALLAWYDKLSAYEGMAEKIARQTAPRAICFIAVLSTFVVLCVGMAFGGGLTEPRVLDAQIVAGLVYQSAFLFDLAVNAKSMKWAQALHHLVVQIVVQYVFGGPRYRIVYAICLMAPALSTSYETLATLRTMIPSAVCLRKVKYGTVVGATVSLAIVIFLQILHIILRLKRGEFLIAVIVSAIAVPWTWQDLIVLRWMWRFNPNRAIASMGLGKNSHGEKIDDTCHEGCVQIDKTGVIVTAQLHGGDQIGVVIPAQLQA